MSLFIAQRHAWSLARTLMVCITLFHAGNGYGAAPTSEFDGDADSIVREYDPFNPWPRQSAHGDVAGCPQGIPVDRHFC